MVGGGVITTRIVLKGCSIRKVKNYCPNLKGRPSRCIYTNKLPVLDHRICHLDVPYNLKRPLLLHILIMLIAIYDANQFSKQQVLKLNKNVLVNERLFSHTRDSRVKCERCKRSRVLLRGTRAPSHTRPSSWQNKEHHLQP